MSSVPRITTAVHKSSSSAAINIPSLPLTPHLGYDQSGDGQEVKDDHDEGCIFSSRFRTRLDGDGISGLVPLSNSAPSAISPIQLQSSSTARTGFTFSTNLISPTQSKGDRKSYDVFVNAMEDDYWKSVSTIRTTYFFDGIGRGGGFLAIPHIASHGNAKTNVICRLLEEWLNKKLVEPTISDSIPVLEDNIESSVQSIEQHLRQDPRVWSGISKSFIKIRCGHVFMLDTCCDDETIVHLGAHVFCQEYPLFVDVEIKMHCDSNNLPKDSPTEILIAFQNVVNRHSTEKEEKPYVHRVTIHEEARRRQSQDSSTTLASSK
ncbi:hypothetical protein BGZ65_003817 [Modicella reniformis]|uniref:Uncharacterized protein n=1 Tax=Modicella reniformis TaxID=1440133 RepID=A0A9P6MKR9_9FUNG|nr:hypothetical protein BGZ65_003817 [Modicella reniformis]